MSSREPDFSEIFAKIESSCQKFQIPQLREIAEKELLEFQRTPLIFDPALYILQHSKNPTTKFHACRAIVFSIFKEYKEIKDISKYIQALINHSLACGDLSQYWTRRCLNSAACLIKRAYLDSPQMLWEYLKFFFHNETHRTSLEMNIGLYFIKSILLVFADSKVGISFEFHFQCKSHFQSNLLFPLLELLSSQLLNCLQQAKNNPNILEDSSSTDFVSALFSCLDHLLNWDFILLTPTNPCATYVAEFSPSYFPMSWHPIITSDVFIQMLFAWSILLPSTLLHTLMQSLFALSNFSSVPSPLDYCSKLLTGTLKLSESILNLFELKKFSLIYGVMHRLVLHFDLQFLFQISTFSEILLKMGQLAIRSIVNHSAADYSDPCQEDETSEMISMWSMIASCALKLNMEGKIDAFYLQEIARISNPIVQCFLRDKQEYIAEKDLELEIETNFKDWDLYDGLLVDLGILCRLDPETNSNFISYQLQNCLNSLSGCDKKSHIQLFEGLHWLLMVSACFLADSSEHEFSQIPLSILQCPSSQTIQNLCTSIFQLLQPNFVISPSLMTTVLWAVQRIMSSYICVSKDDYLSIFPEAWTSFNETFLMSLLPQFYELLLKWQSEIDVVEQLLNIFETCANVKLQRSVLACSDTFFVLGKSILQSFNYLPEHFCPRFISFIVRVSTFNLGHPLLPIIHACTGEVVRALPKNNYDLQAWLKTINYLTGIASALIFSNADVLFPILVQALEVMLSAPLEGSELFSPLLELFYYMLDDDILYLDTPILKTIFHFLAFILNHVEFGFKESDSIIDFMQLSCIFCESQHLDMVKLIFSKISKMVSNTVLPREANFIKTLIQLNTAILNQHPSEFLCYADTFCQTWWHILEYGTSEQWQQALAWFPAFSKFRLPSDIVIQSIFGLVFQISNLEEARLWIDICKYFLISHFNHSTQIVQRYDELAPVFLLFKEYNEKGGEWEQFEKRLFEHVYNISRCGLTAAVL